jgi:hypothetical protein
MGCGSDCPNSWRGSKFAEEHRNGKPACTQLLFAYNSAATCLQSAGSVSSVRWIVIFPCSWRAAAQNCAVTHDRAVTLESGMWFQRAQHISVTFRPQATLESICFIYPTCVLVCGVCVPWRILGSYPRLTTACFEHRQQDGQHGARMAFALMTYAQKLRSLMWRTLW